VTAPLVTLVVLNYNGRRYLRRLMRSLLAQTHAALEVLVVDNASPDGSAAIVEEEFPDSRVRVLRLERNGGFSAGNNAALRQAQGDYVMLLNNDLELDPTCVERLVAAAETRGRFGALAPKILWFYRPEYVESVGTMCTEDGTGFNHGVGHVDVGQFDVPERVFGACFAAALFRRAVFDEVGLLDESYFMYYEDTDWSYRANRLGLPTYTVPDARVFHVHSGSLRYAGEARKHYFLARNRVRFCLLNLPGTRQQLLLWLKVLTPLRYPGLWRNPHDVARRLRVAAHITPRLPALLAKRWRRRRDPRATVPDIEFLSLYLDRGSYFVSDLLYPEPSSRALVSTFRELFRSHPTAENAVRLAHVLALVHLLRKRPSRAVLRAAFDAWVATLAGLPYQEELARVARTVSAIRRLMDGRRLPGDRHLRFPDHPDRSRPVATAAFALAAVFGATGDVGALRALGLVLANLEYRAMRKVGGMSQAGEGVLAGAWAECAASLSDATWAGPGGPAGRAAAERLFAFGDEAGDAPPEGDARMRVQSTPGRA
jgi:hypothetical protein